MADVFRIAEILVAHAVQAHPDEIAIVAYSGSHARGGASPTSDLDIFYIPDDGNAQSLSSQFVIDGLPYDFWPVSWKLAESIADARPGRPWAVAASLIADAKVLYHRAQPDLDRFNSLKARIADLTRQESRRAMVERALEAFKETLFQLGQMRLAVANGDGAGRCWAGWKFVNSAVNCLALLNQTYLTKGWGANLSQVLRMPQKPADLDALIGDITASTGARSALEQADRLAGAVRDLLLAAQASVSKPAQAKDEFKDFYFFILEYKTKIVSACEREDAPAAGYAAFQLQEETCRLLSRVEYGFHGTDFNLLGEYDRAYRKAGFPDLLEAAARRDLKALARRVQRLDERAKEWLTNHSIELNILTSEEELRRFLDQRDPVR